MRGMVMHPLGVLLIGTLLLLATSQPSSALLPNAQSAAYEVPLRSFDLYSFHSAVTDAGRDGATAALSARYGGNWHVYSWNPQTGTPSQLYGSGVNLAAPFTSVADIEAAARGVIAANPSVFQADNANLRFESAPVGMGKWAVHFQQTYQGLDVWGGRVHLTFTEQGRLFVMGSDYYSGITVNPTPRLSQTEAAAIARSDLPYNPATDSIEDGIKLMVLPVPASETEVSHHLVWRVRVHTADPVGIWVTHVDAHDGEILWRYNDVQFMNFVGDANGDIEPDTWCNGIGSQALAYLRIQVSGVGNATTDQNGNWTLAYGGTDSKQVTVDLYGPYVDLNNVAGAEATFTGTATPGVPFHVIFNDSNAQRDERDCFDAVSDIHGYISLFDPSFGYTNQRITCNVSLAQTCNAYWDGTINFFQEGGGCANTGQIQGVVHHEYAHGIQDYILGQQGDQGLGEGNGDILANLMTLESHIGRGFYLSNCTSGIRNSENNLRYPEDVIGEEIHNAGRVIAGFNWDFMEGLATVYGMEQGAVVAGERWHFGRVLEHPLTQPAQVLATFIADDDDGNLDNGTPHYEFLCPAAQNHGFECPEILVGVYIVHTPVPSHEEEGDVAVTARIYSYGSTLIPESLKLTYRVNGGQFIEEVMTPTGGPDQYQAIIPDLMRVSDVEYYLQARDEDGYSAMDPPGAPTELHEFVVAPKGEVLADDIESGAPGWTHAVVLPGFSDQWHISTARNHTPAGASSWKCGDTGSGNYGNLLDAGLVTPPFELLEHSYLHYWQWVAAESSNAHAGYAYDGGIVEISVEGGAWQQIQPDGGYPFLARAGSTPGPFPAGTPMFSGRRNWQEVNFDLSAFEGNAQIRFRFGSDGATAMEGWYVDDVVVDGFLLDSSPVGDGAVGTLHYALLGSRTNPSMGGAEIAFEVPASTKVQLSVFDVTGRTVRTLAAQTFAPGAHSLTWDGTDGNGQAVPSGVYYCRMQTAGFQAIRPLVVSR